MGEQHFKSVVRRILNKQNQDNEDIVNKSVAQDISPAKVATEHPRIISVINRIFTDSDLAVELSLEDGILKAARDGGPNYGVDRLSDGERAALLVIGAILVRPPDSVIAIDEPEKHLNPLISSALIARAIRARPDLIFIIASHDLCLIEASSPKDIIYIRGSEVISTDSFRENRVFDVEILPGTSDVPEDIRRSVLGARKPILFVEGSPSTDCALYKNIFDHLTVVPKGGWEDVLQSVKALSSSPSYHWVQTYGLIDRDGRDSVEVASLEASDIYSLPTPTIENIYLHPAILRLMATQIFSLYGGSSVKCRLSDADKAGRTALSSSKAELVARMVVWQASRELSAKKPSVKSVKSGLMSISGVDLSPIRVAANERFDDWFNNMKPLRPTYKLPIKNTGAPSAVAKALGFPDFDSYRSAVITAMESRNSVGLKLRRVLTSVLPAIG